jgi:uncharacterized protein with HEPN domain
VVGGAAGRDVVSLSVSVCDMIDAAEAAMRFVHGRSRRELDRDELLLFAVVRAIEIVGEAAGKLSDATLTTR